MCWCPPPGAVTVKAAAGVTIDSPQTTVTGKLTVQGLLTYQGGMAGSGGAGAAAVIEGNITATGDIAGGGISLTQHTHPNPEGGNTGTAQ